MKGNIRLRGDTKELYFTDPDGIRVQLQDVKYIGGTGVLGDKPAVAVDACHESRYSFVAKFA